jgi:LmbE family N-acetylglucosaminyl deacetylase
VTDDITKMKEKVLIIVAHPDDETIWMGGTILKNIGNWDATIISLCRKNDPDRAPKFKKICKIYKAKSIIDDLDDEKLDGIPVNEVTKRLEKISGSYSKIFTHGKNGEYGHIRHKDVHKGVNLMMKNKRLKCDEAMFFSYQRIGKYSYPKKDSDKFIYLDKVLLDKKKSLIREVYGFCADGFEDICCRNKEAFKILKKR